MTIDLGIDHLVNFGDEANPAALLDDIVLPGAIANYTNFNDPKITEALEQARGTANPDQRAALVAEAEKLAAEQVPWIPTVQPDTVLILGKGLTGAVSSGAYLFSPWANQLGGTG
jgi:peptide/nickel transport system substrate-binding protein